MRRTLLIAGCIVAGSTVAGAAAASASAEPPEFGACVEVAAHTGEYSAKCLRPAPGKGKWDFVPAGTKKKFTYYVEDPVFKTAAGAEVTCDFGEGEGEYTSGKAVSLPKLIFQNCSLAGAKTVYESFCQNIGGFRGEVTMNELTGELGYIEHNGKTKVGLDIKPKIGKALVLFECGGASELTERGLGTGKLLEVEGSVIGRIKTINKPVEENIVTFTVKRGVQTPEEFEGGVKDTLVTLEGTTKTAQPTTFSGYAEETNEEPIEVKAR
jgi:hypothetical protein